MRNTQFYFATGVPFFTVALMFIVATISNRAALGDLGKRLDDFGKRFDDLGKRIDDLGKRLDETSAHLNRRIDDLRIEVTGRLDRIEKKLDALDATVRENHESRLALLEARVFSKAS